MSNFLFLPDDEPDDIGIYPFNLEPDELEQMYEQPAPDDYAIVLTLLYRDEAGQAFAHDWMEKLQSDSKFQMPKHTQPSGTYTIIAAEATPWPVLDAMSERHAKWWYRGVYIQCGFIRPKRVKEMTLIRGISVAMTWYDARIEDFALDEPLEQQPMVLEAQAEGDPVPAMIARTFRLTVNDLYRESVGVWCRDLVPIRNEILVKVRARISGADPEVAWRQFNDAGLAYYLDFAGFLPQA